MDSVRDFANISFIYHATQRRLHSYYQTIIDSKRENVRDMRDKKRKNYFRFFCSLIIQNVKSASFLSCA